MANPRMGRIQTSNYSLIILEVNKLQNELYHIGVRGMHWGVRKSHDKYGGLTSSGLRRSTDLQAEHERLSNISTLSPKGAARKKEVADAYKKLTGKTISSAKKTPRKEDTVHKDPLKEMDDATLKSATERARLEQQYRDAQPKSKPAYKNKPLHDLSDDELNAYNNRKKLEKDFLSYQPAARVSAGKKLVTTLGTQVFAPVAIDASKALVTRMVEKQMHIKLTKTKK